MQNIFIFGASGHAKVVIDIIERQNLYKIAFLVDDNAQLKNQKIFGYSVIGGKKDLLDSVKHHAIKHGLIAVGDNAMRSQLATWVLDNELSLITAVHPSAQIARNVNIGVGTVVMAGTVINSDSTIGNNVIINTGSTLDHDCQIGDLVHIAPGCHVCGNVKIGAGTFVGAGSTIIPEKTVGKSVRIAAGSTVVSNIADFGKVMGTPAKPY